MNLLYAGAVLAALVAWFYLGRALERRRTLPALLGAIALLVVTLIGAVAAITATASDDDLIGGQVQSLALLLILFSCGFTASIYSRYRGK